MCCFQAYRHSVPFLGLETVFKESGTWPDLEVLGDGRGEREKPHLFEPSTLSAVLLSAVGLFYTCCQKRPPVLSLWLFSFCCFKPASASPSLCFSSLKCLLRSVDLLVQITNSFLWLAMEG